ncbi:MAG: S-adenosylmethionine:tRNA ribosyltransferase-isomerase [Bdellovibrionota bacterium]
MWQDSPEIDFDLPDELIAANPSQKRGQSRLLFVDRSTDQKQEMRFDHIIEKFSGREVLVVNQAKVDHVRIPWVDPKGRSQEIFFLTCMSSQEGQSEWTGMVSGKKLSCHVWYDVNDTLQFFILERLDGGLCRLKVNADEQAVRELFHTQGLVPLPPYILKQRKIQGQAQYNDEDSTRYQTVFAAMPGAVAAPTAGLHFTQEILDALEAKGVKIIRLFLRVGWGTFEPLQEKHFRENKLHREYVEIPEQSAFELLEAQRQGRPIVSVGTTTLRALEWWVKKGKSDQGVAEFCDLFLYPPHRFDVATGLITNFHLPKSSLFLLVSAFMGEDGAKRLQRFIEKP